MKALRLNKAGAKGKLRLSLTLTPTADPGYRRLVHTVQAFHRLLWKEPMLGTFWHRLCLVTMVLVVLVLN